MTPGTSLDLEAHALVPLPPSYPPTKHIGFLETLPREMRDEVYANIWSSLPEINPGGLRYRFSLKPKTRICRPEPGVTDFETWMSKTLRIADVLCRKEFERTDDISLDLVDSNVCDPLQPVQAYLNWPLGLRNAWREHITEVAMNEVKRLARSMLGGQEQTLEEEVIETYEADDFGQSSQLLISKR